MPFSALFLLFSAGVMGGRHIWNQSSGQRFWPKFKDVIAYEGRICRFQLDVTIYISIYSSSGSILLAVFLEVANYSKFQI